MADGRRYAWRDPDRAARAGRGGHRPRRRFRPRRRGHRGRRTIARYRPGYRDDEDAYSPYGRDFFRWGAPVPGHGIYPDQHWGGGMVYGLEGGGWAPFGLIGFPGYAEEYAARRRRPRRRVSRARPASGGRAPRRRGRTGSAGRPTGSR